MSYFVQMAALTVQNFTSAAAGIAVAIALVRGFATQGKETIGNFWVDMTRATVYILLPISFVAALLFASQGVIQNFDGYTKATTVEGATQTIAQGPVASQEAIKQLGTNGGGFFNANSAHPFENPTPFTTVLQILLIFMIPAGLAYTFGYMVRDRKQGWSIFAAMSVMFFLGVFVAYGAEQRGNPILERLGIESAATATQAGGNMEGKEVRFGIAQSTLFATVTTDASCGAVNSMHDSYTPLGGLVPLFNIQTGEVIFGGVGAGLYGILLYAMLAVFIAGLMVGRTPEYVGKRIEQKEVKMAMLALIATAFSILVFTSISSVVPFPKGGYWNSFGPATANVNNAGPHGFAEILYAYTSGTGNNGSAFAGISANTPWYNLTIGLAMIDRPVPVPAAAPGRRGQPRDEEAGADHQRHVADARRAVRRPARRHGDHRRRADVLPGARARPDCRTLPDGPGAPVLPGESSHFGDVMAVTTATATATATPAAAGHEDPTSLLPKKLARSRPLFDPEIVQPGGAAVVRQAQPGHAAQEPRDVRGRGGRRCSPRCSSSATSSPGGAGVHVRRADRRCGCGSPSCSRTSPRRWPRRAARRRPTRCARPRPTCSASAWSAAARPSRCPRRRCARATS